MIDSLNVFITESTGATELQSINFQGVSAGTATDALGIRIYNGETVAIPINLLTAVRSDMLYELRTSEDTATANAQGLELVAESWLEARLLPGDPWTPIDEWAAYLDLGAIAAGGYVAAQIRLNIPAGASTFGPLAFCIAVWSRIP
jgi:hypothetical protein